MYQLFKICFLIAGLIASFTTPASPCSTFMLKTGQGLFFAHNLDESAQVPGLIFMNQRDTWKKGFSWANLLETRKPVSPSLIWKSKYGSVTFNPVGKEFPDGGMNEKGLFIWEMTLPGTQFVQDQDMPRLFMMQWMQYQLDNHSTVDEVIRNCSHITLDGWSWHFFVADKTGRTASIEFIDGKAVIRSGENMPVPVLCNSLYADELRWLRAFRGFGGEYPEHTNNPGFIHAAQMIQQYNSQNPVDYSFDILRKLGGPRTRLSIVFDLDRMEVHFKTSVNGTRNYFAVTSQDFEHNPPVHMLDVHSDETGNVRDKFGPYRDETNHAVLKGFLDLFHGTTDEAKKDPSESGGGHSEQLARHITEKMKLSEIERNFDIAGTWTGSVFYPPKESPVEAEWTMKLEWEEEQLTGEVRDSTGLMNDVRMGNVRYQNGLLLFTLTDQKISFIVDCILAITPNECKGILHGYPSARGKIHLIKQ